MRKALTTTMIATAAGFALALLAAALYATTGTSVALEALSYLAAYTLAGAGVVGIIGINAAANY